MSAQATAEASPVAPLWGELRYSGELMRLLADAKLRSPRRVPDAGPVLLIPGFMAGDASLTLLRQWLRRRGHRVAVSGLRANVDCAERTVSRLQQHLRGFAQECGRPVVLIGQSRGGAIARALAVRDPDKRGRAGDAGHAGPRLAGRLRRSACAPCAGWRDSAISGCRACSRRAAGMASAAPRSE